MAENINSLTKPNNNWGMSCSRDNQTSRFSPENAESLGFLSWTPTSPNAVSLSQPHIYKFSRVDNDIISMLMLASCSWPHFGVTDTNNPISSFFCFPAPRVKSASLKIFASDGTTINRDGCRRSGDSGGRRYASALCSLDLRVTFAQWCGQTPTRWIKKNNNKITQPGPKMLFYLSAFWCFSIPSLRTE